MATESALLSPPTNNSPEAALQLSQAAPTFFASQRSFNLPWPLSLLSASESQEKWQIYHNVFLACLQSGDNESAYLCLEEIIDRFGKDNERVMALQGLYEEATAKNDEELQAVLSRYEELLKEDPTLFAVQKRRAALLRSMGKTSEAVVALTYLLDSSPIDAEGWAELADIYLTQGLYEQAIFSLEEVLLVTPNAWNIHARLGEVLFLAANKSEGAEQVKGLSEAMRRFCRSIELCDDYLRGYYGLKLVRTNDCQFLQEHLLTVSQSTNRLIPLLSSSKPQKTTDSELPPPTLQTTQKLNQAATAKLAEIVRRSKSGEKSWDGYSEAELIAAQELLNRDAQNVAR